MKELLKYPFPQEDKHCDPNKALKLEQVKQFVTEPEQVAQLGSHS